MATDRPQSASTEQPRIPPVPNGTNRDSGKGLSPSTQHILIAAGSVLATLIIGVIVFFIYFARKKRLGLKGIVRYPRNKARDRLRQDLASHTPTSFNGAKSPAFSSWKRKASYDDSILNEMPSALPTVVVRRNSDSENWGRKPSLASLELEAGVSQHPKSFLDDETPPVSVPAKSKTNGSRSPDITVRSFKGRDRAPSSPVLPIHTGRESVTTRQTRDLSSEDPTSPKTFQQSLQNRGITNAPKASRFSWTNSQAAPTPKDPSSRFSLATSARSSIPRFRTVDSWVANQTNRLEEQRLREENRESRPPLPIQFPPGQIKEEDENELEREPPAPKKRTRRAARDRPLTGHSDHTVFRHHPGTEVELPRASLVPSEILNGKVDLSTL